MGEKTLLVCGGRDFADYELLKKILTNAAPDTIISGAARGADSLAARFAREHNVPIEEFPADWKRLGRRAGPIRNGKMLERLMEQGAGTVIAFWDGRSRGTADMIRQARRAGVQVMTIEYRNNKGEEQ